MSICLYPTNDWSDVHKITIRRGVGAVNAGTQQSKDTGGPTLPWLLRCCLSAATWIGAGSGLFVLLAGVFRVRSWRLIAPYSISAALGLTIGKSGSDINDLLEFSAAMSVALGTLIAWVRPRSGLGQLVLVVLALQLVVLVPPSRYH